MWVRILKNNIIYAIGSVANSGALFLLIPFLVNALTPAEFGAWSIYEILVIFIGILITAGMDIGLMRQYWFLNNDLDRKVLGGTVLLAVITWGMVFFGVLFGGYWLIYRSALFHQFHLDVFSPTSLLLVYFIGYSESVFTVLLAIFRIREQAVYFVVFSVGKMILFLSCAIIGQKITGNINGALAGRLLSAILGVVGASILILKIVRLKFDISHLRRILRYGLPLIPASFSSYILFSSDRYILNAVSNLTVVAAYSFAYKVASALDVLIARPFATDWAARRYRIATQSDPQSKYADVFILYFFVSSLSALGLIAFSPVIYKLIAPAIYLDGIRILPIIVFAILIFGLSYPLNIGLVIKDKTSTVGIIGIISAIFCLAIELWLIPHFGMVGAAWATLLSYIVWTGGITIFSLKVYPIPYKIGKILGIGTTTILGYAGIIIITHSLPINLDAIQRGLLGVAWLLMIYSISAFVLLRPLVTKPMLK